MHARRIPPLKRRLRAHTRKYPPASSLSLIGTPPPHWRAWTRTPRPVRSRTRSRSASRGIALSGCCVTCPPPPPDQLIPLPVRLVRCRPISLPRPRGNASCAPPPPQGKGNELCGDQHRINLPPFWVKEVGQTGITARHRTQNGQKCGDGHPPFKSAVHKRGTVSPVSRQFPKTGRRRMSVPCGMC